MKNENSLMGLLQPSQQERMNRNIRYFQENTCQTSKNAFK